MTAYIKVTCKFSLCIYSCHICTSLYTKLFRIFFKCSIVSLKEFGFCIGYSQNKNYVKLYKMLTFKVLYILFAATISHKNDIGTVFFEDKNNHQYHVTVVSNTFKIQVKCWIHNKCLSYFCTGNKYST